MICPPCARASDQRAPRNQHCDDPGCTCGHKAERYGTATGGAQQFAPTIGFPPMRIAVELLDGAPPPINLGRLLAGYDDELHRTDTTEG